MSETAVFQKSATERVEVVATQYRGRAFVNARVHFLGDDGEWHPTKKGLTLSLELAADVARAMLQVAGEEEGEPGG